MKMTTPLALLVATILASATTRAPADEAKGDLALLEGSWMAKVGPGKDIPIILVVKEGAAEITVTRPDGGEIKLKGRLKVDEQANPKTLDWLDFATPQGDALPANLGIYKIDGDTWTTCSGGPGNARPSKFEEGEGGPPVITTWTRSRDKPASGDLARFQGSWTGKGGADGEAKITLTIKDSAITARWERGDGTEIEFKGSIRVNDQAKPKTVDFYDFKRSDGKAVPENLGVYDFDGDDKVRIQTGGHGNERPTELKPGDEPGPNAFTLSRKKD